MLQEAIEVFKENLQKYGDRIIIDSYIPKDGTYRLIEMKDGGDWKIKKTVDIYFDKKENNVVGSTESDYLLICELDYKSKLLEMNKPIDPKKVIHSNNCFSLAVKKDSIITEKLSKEILMGYYKILKNPVMKYEKKAKAKKLYELAEKKLGQPNTKLIERIEEYVLNHNIWEGMNLEKKDYAKVFFIFSDEEKTKELYQIENERYLTPNIYNNNNYNIEVGQEILGLPNNNMGMNSKKPYLENKTRKQTVPYLLNQEDVLIQSQFFDYLMGQVSKKRFHIYIDKSDEEDMKICSYTNKEQPLNIENGYYLRCSVGKAGAEICDADVITCYNTSLKLPFYLKNYIEIPEEIVKKSKINYNEAIQNLWEIQNLINAIFFEGKLKSNFFTEAKDINIYDSILKQCVLDSRDVLANWFWRNTKLQVANTIDSISLQLIKNSILKREIFAAQRQFNLRWSLLEYLNKQEIGVHMKEIRNQLRQHINLTKDDEWDFVSDEEYCYGVGQAVSYLLSLSKSNYKRDSYINPYLNAKKPDIIKKRLLQSYKKYNYIIMHVNGGRTSQILSHLMMYTAKKIYPEIIMAGFVSTSLLYEKKDNEKKQEEN